MKVYLCIFVSSQAKSRTEIDMNTHFSVKKAATANEALAHFESLKTKGETMFIDCFDPVK